MSIATANATAMAIALSMSKRMSWADEAEKAEEELLQRMLEHQRQNGRCGPQGVRKSMQEVPVSSLGNEAECLVADLALKAFGDLESRFLSEKSGSVIAEFSCPAFISVNKKKASIPYSLSTNKEWISDRLKETLKGIPESAEINFRYWFTREDGRLKDEKGDVRVTVNW
jgi:hypothetical protein